MEPTARASFTPPGGRHHRRPPLGDGRTRGGPLSTVAGGVGEALAQSSHLINSRRVAKAWEHRLEADDSRGLDVWVHADLMPGNLLVREGRLAAVIDLGCVCVGDPAVDLMPAWNLMGPGGRHAYRQALVS